MKTGSIIIHIPVVIKVTSEKALRDVVRELKVSGSTFQQEGEPDSRGSFKIITNGVKIKDVRAQLDRLQNFTLSDAQDAKIFQPRRPLKKRRRL